jgi:hypothetical protein
METLLLEINIAVDVTLGSGYRQDDEHAMKVNKVVTTNNKEH